MFNIERLEQARRRRRMSAKELSEKAGIAPVTLSRIINKKQTPDDETIIKLVKALNFPESFFERGISDVINKESANFRSLTSMTARERDAALTGGEFAYEVTDWLKKYYRLPETDILNVDTQQTPTAAARVLRQHWGIGERPIGKLIKLLEAKGIRVFSLAESTKNVDAFSVWRNDEPYIFLNTYKTAERSRFDAAHELGHLVLHKSAEAYYNHKSAETEANEFASEFLMPEADVRSLASYVRNLDQIINLKKRWGVSASALNYRLHKLKLLSDWQYRTLCIQINQRYGKSEPESRENETSAIWDMVLQDLWKQRISKYQISRDLGLPETELENLIFGLFRNEQRSKAFGKTKLSIVK